MKKCLLLTIFTIFLGTIGAQPVDPLEVPFSIGDAFVNPSADALVANPALLPIYKQTFGRANHERLFWGFGESAHKSSISFNFCEIKRGLALDFNMFGAPIESKWSIGLSYAMLAGRPRSMIQVIERTGFYYGIRAELISRGFDKNSMQLAQPDDPVFANSTSKLAPNLGVGIAYKKKFGTIYAGAYNLLMPNLALGNETERLGMFFQLGYMRKFGKFTFVDVACQYDAKYKDFALDFTPMGGVSFTPNPNLYLGAFGSSHSAGVYGTYSLEAEKGVAFTYRMSYPLEGVGFPTHQFAIEYRRPKGELILPDLMFHPWPTAFKIEGKPTEGETLLVTVSFENTGDLASPETPLHITFGDSTISSMQSGLAPGEKTFVSAKFVAKKQGEYKLHAAVNRTKPERSSESAFVEKNIDNNFADTSFNIFGKPTPQLLAQKNELRLVQKFSIAEDEPLVPILFFGENDSTLDPRFEHTIAVIAERLIQNPEVRLEILGFIVEDEPEELAQGRARAVANAFAAKNPSLASRIGISTTHDFRSARAEREKFQGTRLGGKLVLQENRRAELKCALIEKANYFVGNDNLPADEILAQFERTLDRNPEVFLAVRAKNISKALEYKNVLAKKLRADFAERIFSQPGFDGGGIELVLSPSGLVSRPPQVVQPEEGFSVDPDWALAEITLEPHSELPVKKSRITITKGAETITTFENKNRITWNFRDKNGELAMPGEKFLVSAELWDTLDQYSKTEPIELRAVVQNINEVRQRLILLQFAFAGDRSESEFIQARMEYVAKKVIERLNAGDVNVVVSGHTDTIGTFEGNQKLSERRAAEQLDILRDYILALMSFSSKSQLESFVSSKNSTLTSEGKGMTEPFKIVRLNNSIETEQIVGLNSYPEGRIKNRRVEILFVPNDGKSTARKL